MNKRQERAVFTSLYLLIGYAQGIRCGPEFSKIMRSVLRDLRPVVRKAIAPVPKAKRAS
jgi:hypothetical protein